MICKIADGHCLSSSEHGRVMTITERQLILGDTSVVNMVQRASKKVHLEPGDTKWQWKGEAAAAFVCIGITSSRALPTSSAGYWPHF